MYEQKPSQSPLVHTIWHAVVEHDDIYQDPANEYWSINFVKRADGNKAVELYGPSLKPRSLAGHTGEEYWGIEFRVHVVMHDIQKLHTLDACLTLPSQNTVFTIGGRQYTIPNYDQLETFVIQLEQDGIIAGDDRVYRALEGNDSGYSARTRQRHVKAATGLTQKQIKQLRRAQHAYYLLQSGTDATTAAAIAGYADQPHLIRSLRLLRGETPAQIIAQYLSHTA